MRKRQLYLLRHAKSDWNTNAINDFGRPLNKRGKFDAPRIGGWLSDHGHVPDHAICSPAKRARKTLTRIQKVLRFEDNQVSWEPRVYGASLDILLTVLAECSGTIHNLLLVGHNPGLEDLLAYLCPSAAKNSKTVKLMPTAAVAVITIQLPWSGLEAGSGTLESIVQPRSLP